MKHVYNVWIQLSEGSMDFIAHLSVEEADALSLKLQAAKRAGDMLNSSVTKSNVLTASTAMPAVGAFVRRMTAFHNTQVKRTKLKPQKVRGNYK